MSEWDRLWASPTGRFAVERQTEDGHVRHRFRSNVPRDGAVVVAVRDDRVLVVQVPRPCVDRTLWELPRGQGESEDAGPLEVAARELREETGVVLGAAIHLGQVWPDSGILADGVHVVVAEEVLLTDDVGEFPTRWMSPQEWTAGVRAGEVRDGISLSAMALARAHGLLGSAWG